MDYSEPKPFKEISSLSKVMAGSVISIFFGRNKLKRKLSFVIKSGEEFPTAGPITWPRD